MTDTKEILLQAMVLTYRAGLKVSDPIISSEIMEAGDMISNALEMLQNADNPKQTKLHKWDDADKSKGLYNDHRLDYGVEANWNSPWALQTK